MREAMHHASMPRDGRKRRGNLLQNHHVLQQQALRQNNTHRRSQGSEALPLCDLSLFTTRICIDVRRTPV